MQSYFYFHISICHNSCFIKAVYTIPGKAVKEHWFLKLPWIPSNKFLFYDTIIFYNSVFGFVLFFITLTSSSSTQPQLVKKPWQKGLSGLIVRAALPITTKNQAEPDYGHNILVRLKSVTTRGHGVFMSHSRHSIFLLSMIPCSLKISLKLLERVWFFSLNSCQEMSLPVTFSVMQANCLSRCPLPLQTQAISLLNLLNQYSTL